MTEPLTISSSYPDHVTISSEVPPMDIMESTIEHIASSTSPRSTSSDDIALLEAREEAARLALEASEARLRLLEARARSRRASTASSAHTTISSMSRSPTNIAADNVRLPIREELIPPRGRETHNETDSRREMSPDRAWWFDVPEAPTINPRRDEQSDDRGGRAQLGGDRSISLGGGSQDQGAGVGTLDSLMFLDTFFKSANSENPVFMTPRESRVETVNLLMLTPPRGDDEPEKNPEARHLDDRERPRDHRPRAHHQEVEKMPLRAGLRHGDRPEKYVDDPEILHDDRNDEVIDVFIGERAQRVDPPPGLGHEKAAPDVPPRGPSGSDDGREKQHEVTDDFEYDLKIAVKEADGIKLLPLPEAPRLTQWKQHLRDKVVSASGRGDEAFKWILQAENPEIPDEALAPRGKFVSLDAKLGAAFNDILKGRIGTIITDAKEKAAERGDRFSGRLDRKSTRLNSSHSSVSRMPSSA